MEVHEPIELLFGVMSVVTPGIVMDFLGGEIQTKLSSWILSQCLIVNIPSCLPGNHNKEGKMAVPNYFVSDFFTEGWCEPRARIGKVVIDLVQCDNP